MRALTVIGLARTHNPRCLGNPKKLPDLAGVWSRRETVRISLRMARWAAFSLVSTLPLIASATPAKSPSQKSAKLVESKGEGRKETKRTESVGSPTEGKLVGGVHLDDTPYLRVVPVYASSDVRWGVPSLVQTIDRAARSVRQKFPDAVLSVGHLSRQGGGELDHHASHESGRDADVGFYVKNNVSKPVYEDHFVAFKGDGTSPAWPGAHFDDARNWAFINALVTDPHAHLTHIFVAAPLRARLLAYATKMGAPAYARTRAAELLHQPHGSLPHDDHFHLRVACPALNAQCVELPLVHNAKKKNHATAQASKTPKASPNKGAIASSPSSSSSLARPNAEKLHSSEAANKAAKTAPAPREEEDDVPNLGEAIPGLGSVLISKPREGAAPAPAPAAPTPAAPAPPVEVAPAPAAPDTIDDVDGPI